MVVSLLAPVTKIDSAVAYEGDDVTYAVRVWNFKNINAGTLTLDYDISVMGYEAAVPNAAITSTFEANVIQPGRLEMGWNGNVASLADGSILMYLTFEYLGGAAPVLWFHEGVSCQYINYIFNLPLEDEPSEVFYINGNIASSEFVWTGENSSDWNDTSNWINNIIPDQYTNVTIDPSLDPLNWPTFEGNFTLGENCKNLILSENAQFTILGDLTLTPGHTLDLSDSSTLQVSGDWINSGNFNAGTGTVEFTGTGDAIIAQGVPPGDFVAGYTLTTFSAGMTQITGGSSGPTGDNAHSDVNIGFTFKYLGVDYSQVRINTNGWLSLNLTGDDASSLDNTSLFTTSIPTTAMSPWWDDLMADADAAVSYLTEGTAPTRVFTAEWKNILAYSSGATERLNFQVKLYESTNIIEFCYGNNSGGTHNVLESASIGIKDATGGPGNFIEATQNSTYLVLAFLTSEFNWPGVNYRLSPPPENTMEEFHMLVNSKASGRLIIQRDVKITGLN
jgi:hypothetical protein